VESVDLFPSGRNGRVVQDGFAKWLDNFLIDERLAASDLRFRSWVVNVKIYDHLPMVFQIDQG